MLKRFWPRSLMGQMLLALALALLLAQAFGAVLLYRAQAERREATLVHAVAMRLFTATRESPDPRPDQGTGPRDEFHGHHGPPPLPDLFGGPRTFRVEHSATSPLRAGEPRMAHLEEELRELLAEQNIPMAAVVITKRQVSDDPGTLRRLARRAMLLRQPPDSVANKLLVTGIQREAGGEWLVVRAVMPPYERGLLATLVGQTLLIYGVLVGAMAFILRRITEPLRALTRRLERFADTRDADGQMEPEGPDDVRRLIVAHNAMEARIAGLLDEKDVMLGAIGHDLKTPLSALRVRIESVEDEGERARMAATIEDIVRSLDDILSLARVGRPSDPMESTELSALVASVVEEFEDMGEAVELHETVRLVMPLRTTWLRRALRNLVSNALRYGKTARVSQAREQGWAVVRIDDDGPGIAEGDIARMQEPFTRGEPSRNSVTGGAGLGLTLARAIAEQHGGTLTLLNRRDAGGGVLGLTATLKLPLRQA
jgi:signal transduction histidine kinase